MPHYTHIVTCALTAFLTAAPVYGGGFESQNIDLLSWIPLSGFASNPNDGNDCWGYVSPSGREYALMGLSNALAVVEVTDPINPVIIAEISHTGILWGDIKVYQDHAYVVNDFGGGGMDVVDLSDVDNATVILVQRLTTDGLWISHNIAVDTVSGFLYTCGSNLNGGRLVAYDLSDPDNPVVAGQMSAVEGAGVHDAQVVTYTSGPNDGKQIAFCAIPGIGLDIYDVTDKSNMFRLSRSVYPNLATTHQCWLGDDRQYLYLNDEGDGVNETVIFDVSDLSSPSFVSTYSAGVDSTDHNQYVLDGFIYEADYTAGVRIFCAENPVSPVQVGWFDTLPEGDFPGFAGAWSVYPYLPSGTLIVSDRNRGLFLLDATQALTAGGLEFSFPDGLAGLVDPAGGTSFRVETAGTCSGFAAPGTGMLHYDDGTGFVSVPMEIVSDNVYDAVFPAIDCGVDVRYYVSAETTGGSSFVSPSGAPTTAYIATVAQGTSIVLADDFEVDLGWTVDNGGAASGGWERGVPINDPGWDYDPDSDSDGSGQCWLTGNQPGDSDVDGQALLYSPPLDMTAPNLTISYDYFVRVTEPNGIEGLQVHISGTGGNPWVELALHVVDGGPTWHTQEFSPAQLAATGALTETTVLRFRAGDLPPDSIVEVAIDAFKIGQLVCPAILGDIDGDGIVGIQDFLMLLADWGACEEPCPPSCAADLDDDCIVGITDFLLLLANWT